MEQKDILPTIMVIDDEPANLDIMYEILKKEYNVIGAPSGELALEILRLQKHPELILLDVNMPNMSGLELCKIIKQDDYTKDIPVVFLTSKDKEEDEVAGFAIGAADYITKPFKPARAKARIRTQIALKQKGEELRKKIQELEKSLRVFEHKIARPAAIKDIKTNKIDNLADVQADFSKIFLDDHILDFAELEETIDSKVSMMCMKNAFSLAQLCEASIAIGRYGEILTLYPNFIVLGAGLKQFAADLQAVDPDKEIKNMQMALECLETLSFTLLHWRKQLFSGALNDPNMYDKSLLADIKTIMLIIDGDRNEDDFEELELF